MLLAVAVRRGASFWRSLRAVGDAFKDAMTVIGWQLEEVDEDRRSWTRQMRCLQSNEVSALAVG